MKPETRKHYRSKSKTNCIKAKDKKYLKNWWEDFCEHSKAYVKNQWKKEIQDDI